MAPQATRRVGHEEHLLFGEIKVTCVFWREVWEARGQGTGDRRP